MAASVIVDHGDRKAPIASLLALGIPVHVVADERVLPADRQWVQSDGAIFCRRAFFERLEGGRGRMVKPTIGRTVHFFDGNRTLHATVVAIDEFDPNRVQLFVIDPPEPNFMGAMCGGPYFTWSSYFEHGSMPGSWSWPPRVQS